VNKEKLFLYSLTTSYVESPTTDRSHFVHVLNSELTKLGLQIKTITPHSLGLPKAELRNNVLIKRFQYLPQRYQINSSSIPETLNSYFGIFKIFIMSLGFGFFTFKECLREKPDVFHGHWAFPGGFVSYVLSKLFRKNSVVTIHGSDIPLLNRFKFLRKTIVHSLNNSSMVIANSSCTKNELIDLGVKEGKIAKIFVPPDFVPHGQTNEELETFRRTFTNESSKIVLFVGRLVEVKGVKYLIKSLQEIKNQNVHLIIVGDGVLQDELNDLTNSLGLKNKVTFFGRANGEELGLLHGICEVLVCPSIVDSSGMTEHLGVVIPEAMESGLPVIATAVGGIKDIVKNGVNGLLVEEKNPKAIAESIEKIFSDDALRTRIIKNSRETVKDFLPATIAQEYLKLFEKILK